MTRFRTMALALAVAVVASTSARADDKPVTNKNDAVSVNPLSLIFGLISGNYEHKLKPDASITGAVNYWSLSFADYSWTAIGVGAGYRMYFKPVAPDGWYWEPRVDLESVSEKVDYTALGYGSATGSAFFFGPGVMIGRQWVWEGGFLIDLAIGASYTIGSLDVSVGPYTQSVSLSGFGPSGKFSLGYAW